MSEKAMSESRHLASRARRTRMRWSISLAWAGALQVGLLVTGLAHAAEEDTSVGAEFIDLPPEVTATREAEAARRNLERGDVKDHPGYIPGYRRALAIGLSPLAPDVPSLPGGVTPVFGADTLDRGFRFKFNGYLQAVARASIGKRAGDEGGGLTLHSDAVVPGAAYGFFDHTNTALVPWAQLNFAYGNDVVQATAIIGAWTTGQADAASGYHMPNAQLWFNDAYLTYTPKLEPVGLRINTGVFQERYGYMGQYDGGAYGASLIGHIFGVGAAGTLTLPFEAFTVTAESGIKGELDKAPFGVAHDPSTAFARSEEGSTMAAHGHLGVSAQGVTLTGHYIHSWSQDDRKDLPDDPQTPRRESQLRKDGSLSIVGLDVRVDAKRFGHLYLGGSIVDGRHTNSLSNLVRVLWTGRGFELNERYWGFASQGTGKLRFAGGQYTVSLGTLLRHPMEYWGEGPDLKLSVFGIYGSSESAVRELDMLKYGAEAVYSFSRYAAFAGRLDHVHPNLDESERAFGVITPRLVLRSDWVSREAVTLQYSYYALGSRARANGDIRLLNTASDNPDRHLVAIYGTMWW